MLHRLYTLLDHGEWVQVKREAEQLMLLTELDYYTLGRIYRAGGRACIGLGEFHACVKLFELGMPYALKAQDWDTVGFIRHEMGAAYLVLGDTSLAREHLIAYLLDLAKYTDARRLEGRAHYNLGLLYRQQKEYRLAVAAYRQALNCFVQRGEVRNTADCHQNIAWMLLVQKRPDDARIHIDLAAGFQERLPDDFQMEQLILLAFYHTVVGELNTAQQYLSPFLEGNMSESEEHKASARWVEAQILANQGKRDLALATLDQALAHALTAKAAHLVNLCIDLKQQLNSELGEAAL